uniref:Ubiquitin-like domain-containing protein n=1 Tax=Xiphophorus maculatus TaxID=8083 RepID=A0A3B5PWA7_XIPMA
MVYRIVVKDEMGISRTMDLVCLFVVCAENQQLLIFEGRELKGNMKPLFEYGIQHMSCIQMALPLRGGGLPPLHDRGLGDKEGETRRSKECLMPDV